jgi:hypothetical protein
MIAGEIFIETKFRTAGDNLTIEIEDEEENESAMSSGAAGDLGAGEKTISSSHHSSSASHYS